MARKAKTNKPKSAKTSGAKPGGFPTKSGGGVKPPSGANMKPSVNPASTIEERVSRHIGRVTSGASSSPKPALSPLAKPSSLTGEAQIARAKPAVRKEKFGLSGDKPKPDPIKPRDVKVTRSGVRDREISDKVDDGTWRDDWTMRVRDQTPETMAERRDPSKCKPRPTDSRVNRGAGATAHDEELKKRFVPWCERKT